MFIIWRERYLIAAVMGVCLLFSGVFLLVVTPIYTSTARISVMQETSPLLGHASSNQNASANYYLFTERNIIDSPAVLALAAQMPEVRPLVAGQGDPVKFLQTNLSVFAENRAPTIFLSFSSTDRIAAAKVVNAVIRAYMQYQTRPKAASSAELERVDRERARLEQHIADTTGQMLELERKYGALTIKKSQDTLADRQLAGLSDELHLAHLDTLKLQTERDEAQFAVMGTGGAYSGANDDAPVPLGRDSKKLSQTMLLELDAQLKDLQRQYLPEHPLVVDARRRLNAMQIVYARAVEQEYHIAQEREHDLQAQYDAQQKRTVAVSAAMKQYARMRLDIENDRNAEGLIDDRRRQIEMARDVGTLSIDPFDTAAPQTSPSRPGKLRLPAMALLVGTIYGIALAFLRDWFDDRFRTVNEMRGTINLKLLGTLPKMPDDRGLRTVGQHALLEPLSAVSEACRLIQSAIQLGTAKNHSNSVLITSPGRGDGKSVLASNLAITMARAGKRVLLLDANLRYPSQHEIFGLPNDRGLSSVLEGSVSLNQSVQPTEIKGLDLLTAGPTIPNPADLLNTPQFKHAIDAFLDRYDQLLIDSAPVLGISDSRIVASSCDWTVLVLRAGTSTRRMSELAQQSVTSVGTPVLGMVINEAADGTAEALSRNAQQRVLLRLSHAPSESPRVA